MTTGQNDRAHPQHPEHLAHPNHPAHPARTVDAVLRLRRDATLEEVPGQAGAAATGAWLLSAPAGAVALPDTTPGLLAVLTALAADDHAEDRLAPLVTAHDGEFGLLRLHMLLHKLDAAGMTERAVRLDGEPIARLRQVGRGRLALPAAPAADALVKLSRFATATAEGGLLVVRAPGSPLALELSPASAGLLGVLADWNSPAGAAELSGLPDPAVSQVLRLCAAGGLLVTGGPEHDPETGERRLAQWSAADLALHSRTRGPRTVTGYGGTYPLGERFGPEPASREPFPGRRIALAVPDLDARAKSEASLSEVLERRRSIREHDADAPITLEQLGELLYRSMRLRQTFTGGDGQELADRPYPSGGSVHELEVYPLITECVGAEPGLWHYAPDRHELELVAEPGPATAALVESARGSALMDSAPQVTLLVAARFGRVMWKYETVAYSLVLKHVGVLYQTFYLVGTAMGLAVCGLGGGDADEFAAASGLDRHSEGAVGELVVGSRPRTLRHSAGVPRGEEQS
ncbi:SagB family peptide dehydrogenase [Streptomyces virginiae]|uniref:SagB family peptide dehydrogenase n=1 Tax=Streptomyces virginiae TaxID=1961 RepID=UPI002257A18F|nr:SagB family peptide dehydrogenase [Streptomyces virginiae]MCX5177904.1 SagB family peptide dehydrogenase [Streptomyces virginiae]